MIRSQIKLFSAEDRWMVTCITAVVIGAVLAPHAHTLLTGALLILFTVLAGVVCPAKRPTQSAKSSDLNSLWLLTCSLVLGGLLISHFPVREFYYDSSAQIDLGAATREAHFLVTHGQKSGAGIPNPPLFAYIMGLITTLTEDPKLITAFFSITTFLSLHIFIWMLSKRLSASAIHLISPLIAISPGIILYTNLLWEGSLIFLLMGLMFMLLLRYLQTLDWRFFTGAALAVTLIAQCHQSGFFLYPVLAIIGVFTLRSLGWKGVMSAALITLVLSLPYAQFVLSELSTQSLSGTDAEAARVSPITILLVFAGTFSHFHNHYTFFERDFPSFLERAAGPLGGFGYLMSTVIPVLFLLGWLTYLVQVFRGRGFSFRHGQTEHPFTLAFHLSGLIVTVVFVGYAFALPYIWFKHALIIFPCYFILAAQPGITLWKIRFGKLLLIVTLIASLMVSVMIIREIDRAGGSVGRGAIQDYQLSYQTLESIRDRIEMNLPPGTTPVLYTSGYWEGPLRTVVLNPLRTSTENTVPFYVGIYWRASSHRFRVDVRPISLAAQRHKNAQSQLITEISAGTSVTVNPGHLHRVGLNSNREHYRATHTILSNKVGTSIYKNDDEALSDWVVLDTSSPWSAPTATTADVLELLASGAYRLHGNFRGITLLTRNATPVSMSVYQNLNFHVFESFSFYQTGAVVADPQAFYGMSRVAEEQTDRAGFLCFGPYLDLPEGTHRVTFRYQVKGSGSQPSLRMDITHQGGQQVLDEVIISQDTAREDWEEIELIITAGPDGLKDTEFRVFYFGSGEVSIDVPQVTLNAE